MEWITNTTILNELRTKQPNEIWVTFVDTFMPMLVRFARNHGVPRSEAEDAAQEVLAEFVKGLRAGKYDKEEGRLHDWLFGIARYKIRSYLRRIPREVTVADNSSKGSYLENLPDIRTAKNMQDSKQNRESLLACIEYAAKKSSEKTFAAFKLYALEGLTTAEVAEKLGMTVTAVYLAKHRVLARMREYAEKHYQTV